MDKCLHNVSHVNVFPTFGFYCMYFFYTEYIRFEIGHLLQFSFMRCPIQSKIKYMSYQIVHISIW